MKLPCNVIQDLLSLYAEKLTSEDSNALIDEHLKECETCREYLNSINSDEPEFETNRNDTLPLESLRKSIRTRKIKAVSLCAMIVFLVMFTAFSYLTKPKYISYEDSGIQITENEDIYINFSEKITAYKMNQYISENNKNVIEIEAWTSIWDKILGKSTPAVLIHSSETEVDTIFYCDYTEEENMKIVYGENPYADGGVVALPRLVLGYYFIIALIVAVCTGIVWMIMRKNRNGSKVCMYLFLIPVSYLISSLLLSTGFITFSAMRDFIMNLIAAVGIYGIIVLGISLFKQYKEDIG